MDWVGPVFTRMRLTVGRDNSTPSRSANSSVRWVWLIPLYFSCARDATFRCVSTGVVFGGLRHGFCWQGLLLPPCDMRLSVSNHAAQ